MNRKRMRRSSPIDIGIATSGLSGVETWHELVRGRAQRKSWILRSPLVQDLPMAHHRATRQPDRQYLDLHHTQRIPSVFPPVMELSQADVDLFLTLFNIHHVML